VFYLIVYAFEFDFKECVDFVFESNEWVNWRYFCEDLNEWFEVIVFYCYDFDAWFALLWIVDVLSWCIFYAVVLILEDVYGMNWWIRLVK